MHTSNLAATVAEPAGRPLSSPTMMTTIVVMILSYSLAAPVRQATGQGLAHIPAWERTLPGCQSVCSCGVMPKDRTRCLWLERKLWVLFD